MSEKYKIFDQDKIYFVTFAVVYWVDVFTRREYRDLLIESLAYCQKEKGLEIYAWCIMSNHIHLIVGRSGTWKIEDIIRDFKKYTSVHICRAIATNAKESRRDWLLELFTKAASESKKHTKYQFWQNEYHPIELNTNKMMDQRLNYIHNNPVESGIVEKGEDYVYSSARDYNKNVKGLLNIKFIE